MDQASIDLALDCPVKDDADSHAYKKEAGERFFEEFVSAVTIFTQSASGTGKEAVLYIKTELEV